MEGDKKKFVGIDFGILVYSWLVVCKLRLNGRMYWVTSQSAHRQWSEGSSFERLSGSWRQSLKTLWKTESFRFIRGSDQQVASRSAILYHSTMYKTVYLIIELYFVNDYDQLMCAEQCFVRYWGRNFGYPCKPP